MTSHYFYNRRVHQTGRVDRLPFNSSHDPLFSDHCASERLATPVMKRLVARWNAVRPNRYTYWLDGWYRTAR